MWKPPANVQDTTEQIIASGIAHRMLVESHQSHLPNDPSGCSFWVQVDVDELDSPEHMVVIVQYPPQGHVQGFRAMPGESFGIFGQAPLSEEQQALVERLAEAWKQTNSANA